MFEKLLISTDFSEYSNKIVDYITDIPGLRDVILLHVVKTPSTSEKIVMFENQYRSNLNDIKNTLEEQKEYIEHLGVKVTSVLGETDGGDISDAIISVGEQENVPLIVMGARGRGIISGFFLGSVSSEVLRHSRTSVLIMPYKRTDPVRGKPPSRSGTEKHLLSKILCPVDFSKASQDIIASINEETGISEVILLHVIRSAESEAELAIARMDAEDKLQLLGADLDAYNLAVKISVKSGEPAKEICKTAIEENASMILMSRCGKKDYIKNVILGSTTGEVTNCAQCPVFVRSPDIHLTTQTRELDPAEFPLAEVVWMSYHCQQADRENDRIFGTFVEDTIAGVARCKEHPGGLEVDGVFVLPEFRGRGYARDAVAALVDACGGRTLYMHSTSELITFYGMFGFVPIEEYELPPAIRARFEFAMGNMAGIEVQPMMRMPKSQHAL